MKKIYAHRGLLKKYPENTISSFKAALELNIDGIEFDVHLSKDGIPVVFHDFTLSRMCNVDKYIGELNLSEIKEIKVSDIENIPTLEEVLNLFTDNKKGLNIEFKASNEIYEEIESKVCEMVEDFNLMDRTIFSSFDHRSLHNIKKINSNYKVGALYNGFFNNIVDYALDNNFDAIHPHFLNIDEKIVKQAIANNIEINCYTIDTLTDYDYIKGLDITTAITNIPYIITEL